MKTRIIHSSKGQAAVELAVFGFLIVVAFSILVLYGQQLALQQQLKMDAFRRAMKMAYYKNSSVSYTVKKDTRFIDIVGGFGKGQATAVGGSAMVMWQKGIPGLHEKKSKDFTSYAYYVINDQSMGDADGLERYDKNTKGFDGSEQTIRTPASVWKEEIERFEDYNTSVIKNETKSDKPKKIPSKIINTRISNLKDTITTKVYLRKDVSNPPDAWTTPNPVYVNSTAVPTAKQGAVIVMPGDRATVDDDGVTKYTDMNLGDTDPNRVAYTTPGVGTTVYREREWGTDILRGN